MVAKVIGIIDYGMGNLLSVYHAVNAVGAHAKICQNPEDLNAVDHIILPGVGAFSQCIRTLHEKGFVEALNESVIQKGKVILGICLGMQVMARTSHEGGNHTGLGWFDAEVVKLAPSEKALRVPHVGWNKVTYTKDSRLFSGVSTSVADFYFVHSYHMKCAMQDDVLATCNYGEDITVAVKKDNIFAVQFHPEKSQDIGLKVIENFIKLD